MDFDEKNRLYKLQESMIRQSQQSIADIRKKMKELGVEREKYEAELQSAKKSGDKNKERQARSKLQEVESKYEKIEEQLLDEKNNLRELKSNLDEILSELQQDPAVKKAIDEELDKKYNAKLEEYSKKAQKLNEEKTDKAEEKLGLEILQKIADKDPDNAKKISDYLSNLAEQLKLQEELKTLDSNKPEDLKRFGEIQMKLMPEILKRKEKSGKDVIAILSSNNYQLFTIEILEKISKNMIENGFVKFEKNGSINLNETLKKSINAANKSLKSIDRRIKNNNDRINEYAFSKKQIELATKPDPSHPDPSHPDPSHPGTKNSRWGRFTSWIKNIGRKKLPEPKPQIPGPKSPETEKVPDEFLKSDLYRQVKAQREGDIQSKVNAFRESIKLSEESAKKAAEAQAKAEEAKKLAEKAAKLQAKAGIKEEVEK